MNRVAYLAVVHKEPDSDFGISFLDFPGCVSCVSTFDEVYAAAKEALQFHIDGIVTNGGSIRKPTLMWEASQDDQDDTVVCILLVQAYR